MTVDSSTCVIHTHIYTSSLVIQTGCYLRNPVQVFSYIRLIHKRWVHGRNISVKDEFVWGKKKRYWFIYSKSLSEHIFLVIIKF